MKASSELAIAMGDADFARKCDDSFERTKSALDKLSWIQASSGDGYYPAASTNCTKDHGCATQIGFFSDAFYAQVLAYSAGLGGLVDEAKLQQHLRRTVAETCRQVVGGQLVDGCPHGFVTFTGRPQEATDWQLWQMATHDWAALTLRANGAEATGSALEMSRRSAVSWSENLNDQWNTAGISDSAGYPTVTSHYGYHMTSWHVPLALSGQVANLTKPTTASLTFAPAVVEPFKLPVLLPGIVGTIAGRNGQYELGLTIGNLDIAVLAVNGVRYPTPSSGVISLAAGQSVTWSSQSSLEVVI